MDPLNKPGSSAPVNSTRELVSQLETRIASNAAKLNAESGGMRGQRHLANSKG